MNMYFSGHVSMNVKPSGNNRQVMSIPASPNISHLPFGYIWHRKMTDPTLSLRDLEVWGLSLILHLHNY